METLNPFFPENFHSFDTANQSLNEYHSLKHGLDDSVFSNSNLENSVNKSIAQDESFNYNVDHQEEEEPEEDSALNHSFQQRVVVKVDDKTQSPENESISITDKEILKLEREKAQISHLMNCIPSLNENFTIHQKIGEGTFSSVFLATIKGDEDIKKQFAVKHLVPTCHPNRIEKELRCLMDIGGQDNVVGVDLCLRNGLNVAFVMPFLPHQRFSDYLTLMDVDEIRLYMKNLLVALKRVHSFGVIHRDVKPSNFLYDRVGKRFLLVDFGLAHDVGESTGTTPKEISTSVFLTPKKRKRSEELNDDENTMSRKLPCKTGLRMSPRRPLQSIGKNFGQGENALSQNVPASPTRKPLGNYQGGNISFNQNTLNNPSKHTPSNVNAGEFRILEPKQRTAGGLIVRVQNSKVVPSPISTPVTVGRNGPHRRPLFTPDPQKRLVSPLPPPSTPSLPPPSSQLSTATPTPLTPSVPKGCTCQAMSRVCRYCLAQKPYFAPRAGTPGFRPPEVLLKSHQQTTAVDMWAAGVILLCIASGCYPFFRAPDDITALAEIMTVFGTTRLEHVANKLGRRITCSNRRNAMDLKILSERLRFRGEPKPTKESLPNDAYDLLNRLLDLDPKTRITAEEALLHPFFKEGS